MKLFLMIVAMMAVLIMPTIALAGTCHNGTCTLPNEEATAYPVQHLIDATAWRSDCFVGKTACVAKRAVTAPMRLIGKIKPIRRIARLRPLCRVARAGRLLLPGRWCRNCRR